MWAEEKYTELKARLEAERNEEFAFWSEKYMRCQFRFYGIKKPRLKELTMDLIIADKAAGHVDWEFLDLCFGDEHREYQHFVCEYLAAFKKVLHFEDIEHIRRYCKTKQWWDTIDFLDDVIGAIGLKDTRVDDLMLQWAEDEDFWIRRVAIDHQILRKENTKTALLEAIIVKNFGSKEFFINKAIGWSLRDYSKTNPSWVRAFIGKYRPQMATLSIREASKYI